MIKTNNLYFDTAATTPLDLRVADYMHEINKDIFGNPSSIHQVGQKSHNIIERSRKKISELLQHTLSGTLNYPKEPSEKKK